MHFEDHFEDNERLFVRHKYAPWGHKVNVCAKTSLSSVLILPQIDMWFQWSVSENYMNLLELSWIGCLTSQLTIFQSYMWRHIDVQADWRRSWTYGRAPNAIDISYGSLTCPSKPRHRTNLFIRWFRHTAPISRLLRHAGDTEDTFSTQPPPPHRGLTSQVWFTMSLS